MWSYVVFLLLDLALQWFLGRRTPLLHHALSMVSTLVALQSSRYNKLWGTVLTHEIGDVFYSLRLPSFPCLLVSLFRFGSTLRCLTEASSQGFPSIVKALVAAMAAYDSRLVGIFLLRTLGSRHDTCFIPPFFVASARRGVSSQMIPK